MKNKIMLSLLLTLLLSAFVFPQDLSENLKEAAVLRMKTNLEYFASDELEGRETGSEGIRKTAEHIADIFEEYGVKPYGDEGTYFQNFTLIGSRFDKESNISVYDDKNNLLSNLMIGEAIISMPNMLGDAEKMNTAFPIVFAGYGINAEEYQYSDYLDLDVKGKIVIVFMGEPYSENPEFFDAEKNTNYAGFRHKIEAAQKHGAQGIILIPDEQYLQYWSFISNMALNETLSRPNENNEPNSSIPAVMISIDGAAEIFNGEESSFDELKSLIDEKDIPRGFDLKKSTSINLKVIENEKIVRNVVGIIEGNDSQLKNQYVTIGAHMDHVGVMNDEVFNGADDNASGTVAAVEAACRLAKEGDNKRSIITVLYTGEEKGLIGSQYFVENFENLENIIANINLDMVGRGAVDSIFCIGSDRVSSELTEIIDKANEQSANFYLDYSLSDTRLFMQSDHYSFAKQNIPVAFFFDNMSDDLHRPSDDFDKINYDKIYKTTLLVEDIVSMLSNRNERLKINPTEE